MLSFAVYSEVSDNTLKGVVTTLDEWHRSAGEFYPVKRFAYALRGYCIKHRGCFVIAPMLTVFVLS